MKVQKSVIVDTGTFTETNRFSCLKRGKTRRKHSLKGNVGIRDGSRVLVDTCSYLIPTTFFKFKDLDWVSLRFLHPLLLPTELTTYPITLSSKLSEEKLKIKIPQL